MIEARNDFPRVRGRELAVIVAAATALVLAYLLYGETLAGPGFPLDDAWIHQTYARNLAERGQWAFQPGTPSAGSTSPLWTILLVPAHILRIPPVTWSAALGVMLLILLARTGEALWVRLDPPIGLPSWLPAAVPLAEWHLIWAALSGMETLLSALLPVVIAALLATTRRNRFLVGLLIGVGLWVRPDLVSLSLLVVWWDLADDRPLPAKAASLARAGAGIAALAIPYFAFQLVLSGRLWPSTFFAKQAEYSIRRGSPLLLRYLNQWQAPLAGMLAILAAGCAYWAIMAIRRGQWARLCLLAWPALYLGAFAVRLPVTYQHGRYAVPAIPLLLLIGLLGWGDGLAVIPESRFRRVLKRVFLLSLFAVSVVFLWLGARAYASDLAVINEEMVDAARWISGNTEPNALIAAHDIGALGFFGERRILDLAGLVSPEVIPYLRDESRLSDHMSTEGASYLMTFPSWYPELSREGEQVYVTSGRASLRLAGENMAVYRWVR